jgi:hypothetical protein
VAECGGGAYELRVGCVSIESVIEKVTITQGRRYMQAMIYDGINPR